GSWWGLLALLLILPVLIWRLLDEERFLRENLSDYADYQTKVKYPSCRSFGKRCATDLHVTLSSMPDLSLRPNLIPLHAWLMPEEVTRRLNGIYDCLGDPVRAAGGEILKFLGDGVLAVFLPPDGTNVAAVTPAALAAARETLARVEALNATETA